MTTALTDSLCKWQALMKTLVREVLYACQGVDGKFLTFPSDDTGNFLVESSLGAPTPERQLMLKLAELGWLFRSADLMHLMHSKNGPLMGVASKAA